MARIVVVKANTMAIETVMRSRFFSTTVEPAEAEPMPPPNMSESPPPRPLCSSTSTTSRRDTATWMTMTIAVSMLGRLPGQPILDDSGELVGVEAGPADERAVDVGLGHELGDVRRLHRAAVLDPDAAGHLVADEAGGDLTDQPDGGLGVVGRGRAARPDGPDGLVGHDQAGHLLGGKPLESGLHLPAHLGLRRPGLPLLERLA